MWKETEVVIEASTLTDESCYWFIVADITLTGVVYLMGKIGKVGGDDEMMIFYLVW